MKQKRTRQGNRNLPCQVCPNLVWIADKKRFLRLVRDKIPVRCKQCRGYVSGGSAREPEASAPLSICDLGLAPKCRRRAKRRRALASMPLKRCVPSPYNMGSGNT